MNNNQNNIFENTEKKAHSKKDTGLFFLLTFPFLIFCVGVALLSVFFFKEYVETSNLWRFVINTGAVAEPEDGEFGDDFEDISIEAVSKPDSPDDTSKDENEEEQIYYNKKDFPGFKWGTVWARLSIPSIGVKDKKVYVGDSNDIFKKGIGKRFGTRFPGQGGNIVLGAHVTREFYYLQDLVVGDRVYLETSYGSYVYEIYETFIFSPDDYHYVWNYDDGEKLTLYTCFPRESAIRTERFGVVCKKISGPEWIEVN